MQHTSDFEFVRSVDFAALAAAPGKRVNLPLVTKSNGAESMTLSYIRTPAGDGSPNGLHYHEVDQIFYLVSGTMFVEIDGKESTVEAGSAIVFPAGVPHRNWNDQETVHLSMTSPLADPSKPFAIRVEATESISQPASDKSDNSD